MRTAHQHSGYLTVAVTLIYIGWSLAVIASSQTWHALIVSPLIAVPDRGIAERADQSTIKIGSTAPSWREYGPRATEPCLMAENARGAGLARLR